MPDFKKLPTVNSTAVALVDHAHPGGIPADGLTVWLDADQLTGLADAASVTTWPDASGHSYHATQATGGAKPTYRTAGFNGHPVVRFDGTDDALTTPLFAAALAQPTTIFLVCKLSSIAGAAILDGVGCTDRQVIWYNGGFWGLQSGGNVFGTETVDTKPHVLTAEFAATDTLRVDGTQVLSGDSGAAALGGLRIAGWCDGGGFPPVDIAEILVYDRALSGGERRSVEVTLTAKYGLAIGSPFASLVKWGTD